MKFMVLSHVRLTETQQQEARRWVNTQIIGSQFCNVKDALGRNILDPSISVEDQARLLQAHKNLASFYELNIEATVHPDGHLTFALVPPH